MVSYTYKDSIPSPECFALVMVKVVVSSSVDPGSIPGSSQLRQKSGVGQEIVILQFF